MVDRTETVSETLARPLAGLRVLDFTRIMAGPFCTALLGDLGAQVIKLEPPQGDEYRRIGPFRDGESALFQLMNRNKKSVVLDLKTKDGVALAQNLATRADVVVENFKPGVAARLGLDYDSLMAKKPDLIYASISGFGQHGPFAERPAYDLIAQALSGLMAATGEADGEPLKVGESIGDLSAGLYGSWAILAALFQRERTGRGQHIDVAMFDSLFSLLPTSLSQWLYGGEVPKRVGNRHPLSTPFGTFKARDGHVAITVLSQAQFAGLAEAIGRSELAEDSRFASDESRTSHEPALRAAIEAWSGALGVDQALEALERARVPAAPIWTIQQAAESDQVAARELLSEAAHLKLGTLPLPEQPVHFADQPRGQQRAAPGLGQDSAEVLREVLGLSQEDIERLTEQGVIAVGEET